MSVFRIFKGGTDYQAEYRGTALAGKVFGELWGKEKPGVPSIPEDPDKKPRKPKEDKEYAIRPGQIYEELIYRLIRKGCVVEYEKGSDKFIVKAAKSRGKKILYYTRDNEDFPIDLKVVRDNDNDDVIYMAVPYKRDVTADAGYLADAVAEIKSSCDETRNKEFLFGMLLLKRCR